MISARTKAALAAAKRRGVKLGGDRGARLTAKARAAGRAAVQERVRCAAADKSEPEHEQNQTATTNPWHSTGMPLKRARGLLGGTGAFGKNYDAPRSRSAQAAASKVVGGGR
jgi:hypothetical protein